MRRGTSLLLEGRRCGCQGGQMATPDPEPGDSAPEHWHGDEDPGSFAARLNWLRAGVLGANDGIISTAGLVVGVAGATAERDTLLIAGVAGLLAGAISMAVGEYVSVSSQRDSERAMLKLESQELKNMPQEELEELTRVYEGKGLPRHLAEQVARTLTEKDPLRAHAEAQMGIDVDELVNPMHAAWASFVAFTIGAILPLVAIILPPVGLRVPITLLTVLTTLAVTGIVSARLGRAPVGRAVARNVLGGLLAMTVTYAIGTLIGSGAWPGW